MNYHHRRSGGAWWRDLPPAITQGVAVSGLASPGIPEEQPMDLTEVQANLKELEQILAVAEELRYRIVTALAQHAPRATVPNSQPENRQQSSPSLTRHPDLKRTGRGLFAWAKEHGRVDELVAIGQKMKFPSRIIDWDVNQIEVAITMIDAAEREIQQPAEPKRRSPSGRTRNNGHARVPGGDDERYDIDGEEFLISDIPY